MILTYEITPMGAPRMTRADKWRRRDCVERYFAFKDLVKAHQVTLFNGDAITFVLPMPASWSKKKRLEMDGQLHKQKPDLDNMLKALMDALFGDDCHIADLGRLKKVWGQAGAISINRPEVLR